LAFTVATGDVVICSIILKSDKEAKDLPFTWRLGIDATNQAIPGDGLADTYQKVSKKKFQSEDQHVSITE
jgi:hypothetical protein